MNYIDPTGELLGVAVVLGTVSAVAGSFYFYIKGLEECKRLYPNNAEPGCERQKYLKCTLSITELIARGAAAASDPIGTAAGGAGEAVSGESL